MESYQSGVREADFQKLAQNIGTNIQKILQNGTWSYFGWIFLKKSVAHFFLIFSVSSMQRMIAQIGTPQDNQQLQTQLWDF